MISAGLREIIPFCIEVSVVALVSFYLILKFLAVKSSPESKLQESWLAIVLLVSGRISNGEALQVELEVGRFGSSVVLKKLLDREWNVNSSVRFSRKVKVVILEIAVLLKPL